MGHQDRKVRRELEAIVSVGDGIEGVFRKRGEAEIPRDSLAVKRKPRTGERARAERHEVDALYGVAEAIAVARERPAPCREMMRKGNGLRALHVGVAGHEGLKILPRDLGKGLDETDDR